MLKITDLRRNSMARIPFNVSAKTARLIGRENVSNLEGALIELIKIHMMQMQKMRSLL